MNRPQCMGVALAVAHASAWAQTAAPAATAPELVGPSIRGLLGMLLVVALVVWCGWAIKRVAQAKRGGGVAGAPLRIVSAIGVGPRERVVVVEYADTHLVVGVGGQQVTVLHVMPRPAASTVAPAVAAASTDAPTSPPAAMFQRALADLLGRKP